NRTITTTTNLTGTTAAYYILSNAPSVTGTITPKTLTVTGLSVATRDYDRTTNAPVTGTGSLVGRIGGDVVNLSGTVAGAYASASAGTNKAVTLSGLSLAGSDAGNYELDLTGLTGDVSRKAVTIATLAPTATLVGILTNATALLDDSGATASFADKNVGAGKPVAASGYALLNGTTLASNYQLVQPTGVTGTITAKALTITGATVADRIYDGTADAPVTGGSLVGVLGSEDVQLRALAASYADANIGNAKAVVNTGFSLTGADIGNYTLTQPTLTGKVDPKNLYVTGVTAVSRAYDRTTNVALAGTAVLSGLVTGESLTLNTNSAAAGLANWNADTNKAVTVTGFAVTGATAGNYNLVQVPNLTVDITPKSVSLAGLTNLTKQYDGTTAISLSGISGLTGVINPDDVQLGGSAAGQFADPLVGTNKPVAVTGATLTGADAANYSLDTNLPV
ncbi:MAG: filamentous hemagglutinin, partial [Betaproteobacteria bacterium]|nr:filamentous hemagglutinin [Betaproteobacteria bacterium]